MTNIKLQNIDFYAGTQLRLRGESQLHIEELAHVFIEKGEFSEAPVVGYIKDSKKYVPIDGFHRLMAIQWLSSDDFKSRDDSPSVDHLDLQSVNVEVLPFETITDAIIASAGANATHGMKRQRGDIQNAIEAILEADRERFMDGKYKLNKKAIMAVVNCSPRSYEIETRDIRSDLTLQRDFMIDKLHSEGKTQREISDAVGCTQKTVSNVLGSFEKKTQDAQITQDENAVEKKTQDAQITQEGDSEEETSVFTHMTSAGTIENPWEDNEDTTEPSKNLPEGSPTLSFSATELDASINKVTDDVLFKVLAALTPEQQEMVRNYMDSI